MNLLYRKRSEYMGEIFNDKEEALISVAHVSERIKVFPYYFRHHIPGAQNDCFLREGVVQKLLAALKSIPEEYHFVILDGWRSYRTQQALYDMHQTYFLQRYDKKEAKKQLSRFVAAPSMDPYNPAPHYTGGAVDLTLANEKGWLDMGTDFDEFTEKAHSLFYEKELLTDEEKNIRDRRRLLRKSMIDVGFRSNPDEWWHFDYGNPLWAKENNTLPKYMGIELTAKKGGKHVEKD
ncbi:hypothetical protein NG54_10095 [Heyndrickxia ginsengihumi]|uniref:D-alanyl-D-alanine dipeptidase n=2 Tax=Heyndrickxia ginsengihumi TaxID=363870 RepID=A0A0A6VCW4_9BACI|nr:hypothetical protein NG54_10095 [Heyndrickxia ginsengihumi]